MALNCPVSSFATANIAAANVIYAWPAPLWPAIPLWPAPLRRSPVWPAPLCRPDTIGPMLPPIVYSCPRSSVSDLSEKLRKERMLGHVSEIKHKK